MVIGIAGGLVMCGMILGAVSGSIWLLLGLAAAGFGAAVIAETARAARTRTAASCKLNQYPPYGY